MWTNRPRINLLWTFLPDILPLQKTPTENLPDILSRKILLQISAERQSPLAACSGRGNGLRGHESEAVR